MRALTLGKRGPKKTPTKLLALRGSWRAEGRKDEPKAPAGRPTTPSLSPPELAEWAVMCDRLESMNLLAKTDGNTIERYARMMVEYRGLCAFIAENGSTFTTTDGQGNEIPKSRPEVAQRNTLAAELRRIEQAFGLTPSARAECATKGQGKEQPEGKARFFGGGGRKAG